MRIAGIGAGKVELRRCRRTARANLSGRLAGQVDAALKVVAVAAVARADLVQEGVEIAFGDP